MEEVYWMLLQAVGFAMLAGAVIVLMSLAVEKFGGTIGGVLATTPSTMCATAAAFAAASDYTQEHLIRSMFMVPVGMLLSSSFLFLWRTLPPFFACLSFHKQLVALTLTCIAAWLAAASVLVLLVGAAVDRASLPIQAIGVGFTLTSLSGGLYITVLHPKDDPAATTMVPLWMHALRFFVVALSNFTSIMIAHLSDVVGGIASTFPVVFCTMCFFLTLSHGFEVSVGSVGPMMLGSVSVPSYAMVFAYLYPFTLQQVGGRVYVAIAISTIITWLISVFGVSLNIFLLLRWLKNRRGASATRKDMGDGVIEGEVALEMTTIAEEVGEHDEMRGHEICEHGTEMDDEALGEGAVRQ